MTVFIFFLFAAWGSTHAFHVSKAVVEYNTSEQAVQVSMHLFLDDLEAALKQTHPEPLYLCSDKEKPEAETYLKEYLNRHFRLVLDGQSKALNFLGKEPSEDLQGVWCYLEIPKTKAPKSIRVIHTALMEVYSDQKNIVHLSFPGNREWTCLLSKDHKEETLTL
ncbi:MAG: hypothetical protein KBC60_03550 [Haliscomenobacter sp.]|nr:hypothetical protein [Haliscomenobacter sp.]